MASIGSKQTNPRGYDVDMIRDFLEHLLWEVRIRHAESTQYRGGRTNDELVEQLAKYVKKRNTIALMLANEITPDPTGSVSVSEATDMLYRHNAATAEQQIRALESLQPLFREALACAKRGDVYPVRKRTALQVKNELSGPPA